MANRLGPLQNQASHGLLTGQWIEQSLNKTSTAYYKQYVNCLLQAIC